MRIQHVERLRGFVQERQRLLLEGLALWIDAQPDLDLAGMAESGPELVEACAADDPDFVVFEADAEGAEWDPVDTARQLHGRHPHARLVGVASADTRSAPVVEAGACAVVRRSSGVADLIEAVRGVAAAVQPVPGVDGRVAQHQLTASLTDRELEVLRLVGAGLPAREIAGRLAISPKTVDNHKQRIRVKLGVQSQAHAVAVAMRAGLLGRVPTRHH